MNIDFRTRKIKSFVSLFSLFAFFVVIAGVFSGCTNSLSDMLDEYNQYYKPTKDEVVHPKPGDENFLESEMLYSAYYICTNGSVNLAAPESNTYLWRLYDSKGNNVTPSLKFYNLSGASKKDFRFYIPEAYPSLECGSYKVTLVVTDAEGNAYSDSAILVIYDQLEKY